MSVLDEVLWKLAVILSAVFGDGVFAVFLLEKHVPGVGDVCQDDLHIGVHPRFSLTGINASIHQGPANLNPGCAFHVLGIHPADNLCFLRYDDQLVVLPLIPENAELAVGNALLEPLDRKTYLRKEIEKAKESKSNNGVYGYPATNPYNELVQVGYWCLRRILRAKDYKEFLGNSDEFDFYYEYSSFDFNKFDVSWLLNLYPQTFNEISKNKTVKNKIRIAIVNELKNEELAEKDKKNLQDILINYFC